MNRQFLIGVMTLLTVAVWPQSGPTQFDLRHSMELPGHAQMKRTQELVRVISEKAPQMSSQDQWALAVTVERTASERSLDPYLILSMIEVESGFRASAVSAVGARGLMQIRPFVAESVSLEMHRRPTTAGDLHEMQHNVILGIEYFQQQMQRFNHDPALALAAYNHGPSRIASLVKNGHAVPTRYSQKVLHAYHRMTSTEI